jgi:hypothetical protein
MVGVRVITDHAKYEFAFILIETYHTLVSNLKILDSYKNGSDNHSMILRRQNNDVHPYDAVRGFFQYNRPVCLFLREQR